MNQQMNVGDMVAVKGQDTPAYFQGWSEKAYVIEPSLMVGGGPGGQKKFPVAVVMYENGQVSWVAVELLKRIDQKENSHEQAD